MKGRARRAIRHRGLDDPHAPRSNTVEHQVLPSQRGARGRRLERDDAPAGRAPPRGEHGVDADERAHVEDDVARANRLLQEIEERRLGLVRHEVPCIRVDSDHFVVHLPGQALLRIERTEDAGRKRRRRASAHVIAARSALEQQVRNAAGDLVQCGRAVAAVAQDPDGVALERRLADDPFRPEARECRGHARRAPSPPHPRRRSSSSRCAAAGPTGPRCRTSGRERESTHPRAGHLGQRVSAAGVSDAMPSFSGQHDTNSRHIVFVFVRRAPGRTR